MSTKTLRYESYPKYRKVQTSHLNLIYCRRLIEFTQIIEREIFVTYDWEKTKNMCMVTRIAINWLSNY